MVRSAFLLDPEIVRPSEGGARDAAFWLRMQKWALDHGPLLGPNALIGLTEVMESDDLKVGAPRPEIYAILNRLAGRVFPHAPHGDDHPNTHDLPTYVPLFGDAGNGARLVADLLSTGAVPAVLLATDPGCWPEGLPRSHSLCAQMRLHGVALDGPYAYQAMRDEFLTTGPKNFKELEAIASSLFPRIEFCESAWTKADKLQGTEFELVAAVVSHLGVLNDHAAAIWRTTTQSHERIQLLGSFGVEASRDSPKTHKSDRAMKTRDFEVEGQTIRCEWHTKIRPDSNRIHFAVDGDRVVVGTIVEHLPT